MLGPESEKLDDGIELERPKSLFDRSRIPDVGMQLPHADSSLLRVRTPVEMKDFPPFPEGFCGTGRRDVAGSPCDEYAHFVLLQIFLDT
jgi:hypothetical protein